MLIKKSNFKSKINKAKIFNNYLALANKITKDKKAEPYNFSYAVEFKMENKCSLSTLKKAIERSFKAMLNQLKGEFRERNIEAFDEASKYLNAYKKQFNIKYAIKPIKSKSKFKKYNLTNDEIWELLAIRSYRKTDKANAISYKNTLYSMDDKNNNRVSFNEKSAILMLETLNGKRQAKYMGKSLNLKPTDYKFLTSSQKEQSKKFKKNNS